MVRAGAVTEKVYRELSYHERYSTARTNILAPTILVFGAVVSLPDGEASSSTRSSVPLSNLQDQLRSRVDNLLRNIPSLSAYVSGHTTRQPRWAIGVPVSVEAVLQPSTKVEGALALEQLIKTEIVEGETHFQLSRAPLWSVKMVSSNATKQAAVLLSVHHALTDGKGAANIFEALLSTSEPLLPSAKDITDYTMPPNLHDVLDMRPSWSLFLPMVFSALILPILPGFLYSRLHTGSIWPNDQPAEVLQCYHIPAKKELRLLQFHDATSRLKGLGKKHDLKTIHSLLYAVCAAAAWAVANEKTATDKIVVEGGTPTNLRPLVGKAAGLYTSNYVGSVSQKQELQATSSFWQCAKDLADEITSPAGQARARGRMGMFKYIPDPASQTASSTPAAHSSGRTPNLATGWESFFHKKTSTKLQDQFDMTFSVSNLGRMTMPDFVQEVAWSQRPFLGSLWVVDVCGLTGEDGVMQSGKPDLTMALGWHEGVLPIGMDETFVEMVRGGIELLIDHREATVTPSGKDAVESDPSQKRDIDGIETIGDFIEAVRERLARRRALNDSSV